MYRWFTALIVSMNIIVFSGAAQAHEYYLLPETFTPALGEPFKVSHKLGQRFKGNEMPYIGVWNLRSEVWEAGKMRPVKGLDGDRPALTVTLTTPGMSSVAHQSNVDFLTFESWEKFESYAKKSGLNEAIQASLDGKKPKEKLKEAYSRFAKTIVNGDGKEGGIDTPTGLKIELVALADPLTLSKDAAMPVQLLYEGSPLTGATITVFNGIDTEVADQIITDAEGKAVIAAAGPGPYLLNAIHMTEPQSEAAQKRKSDWESFWASLTFQRAN